MDDIFAIQSSQGVNNYNLILKLLCEKLKHLRPVQKVCWLLFSWLSEHVSNQSNTAITWHMEGMPYLRSDVSTRKHSDPLHNLGSFNPRHVGFILRKIKIYICIFYHFSTLMSHECWEMIKNTNIYDIYTWCGTGSLKPSLWKTRLCLSCTVNTMHADDPAKQGARASAAKELT